MAVSSLFPVMATQPKSQGASVPSRVKLHHTILNLLSVSSWLLIGGVLQALLFFIVPYWWTLIFPIAILGYRAGHTLLITFKFIPNPYLKDSIHTFYSAQVPDADGNFSDTPSAQGVAVLHLGAKFNHPLGPLSPHARTFGGHLDKMYAVLEGEAKKMSGYLGGSTWSSIDARGATELSFISYWRDIESIHAFAYSPSHKAGWEWWNSAPREDIKHLGINHEIFFAHPGEWETIYLNQQPTLLAGTHSWRKGDKHMGGTVEDGWVSNAVDASRGKWTTSAGRLGRVSTSITEKQGYYSIKSPYTVESDRWERDDANKV